MFVRHSALVESDLVEMGLAPVLVVVVLVGVVLLDDTAHSVSDEEVDRRVPLGEVIAVAGLIHDEVDVVLVEQSRNTGSIPQPAQKSHLWAKHATCERGPRLRR